MKWRKTRNRKKREKMRKMTMHRGPDQPKTQTKVMGHSFVRSLVRSHHSLFCLLGTARCAHLLARSLHSLCWRIFEDITMAHLTDPPSLLPVIYHGTSRDTYMLSASISLSLYLLIYLPTFSPLTTPSLVGKWMDGYLFCFFFSSGP